MTVATPDEVGKSYAAPRLSIHASVAPARAGVCWHVPRSCALLRGRGLLGGSWDHTARSFGARPCLQRSSRLRRASPRGRRRQRCADKAVPRLPLPFPCQFSRRWWEFTRPCTHPIWRCSPDVACTGDAGRNLKKYWPHQRGQLLDVLELAAHLAGVRPMSRTRCVSTLALGKAAREPRWLCISQRSRATLHDEDHTNFTRPHRDRAA